MRTAVIFCDGVKQIVLTPENESEKQVLAMIDPSDDIELLVQSGSFGNEFCKPFTYSVNESNGGFLRLYHQQHSRILVMRPRDKNKEHGEN